MRTSHISQNEMKWKSTLSSLTYTTHTTQVTTHTHTRRIVVSYTGEQSF